MIPLTDAGLGQVLRANRRGALSWHAVLDESDALTAYQQPELDIVAYFPTRDSMSAVDAASASLFRAAATGDPSEQIHLATYTVKAADMTRRGHLLEHDADTARILRSTVMKPESESHLPAIHAQLTELATTP